MHANALLNRNASSRRCLFPSSYDLTLTDDCLPVPDGYAASAATIKSVDQGILQIEFQIQGGAGYKGYVPEGLQEEGEEENKACFTVIMSGCLLKLIKSKLPWS